MEMPKSLTAVVHLPDVKLHLYLSFESKEPITIGEGVDAKLMGRILDKASGLPPELQEMLVGFADHIMKTLSKPDNGDRQSPEQGS